LEAFEPLDEVKEANFWVSDDHKLWLSIECVVEILKVAFWAFDFSLPFWMGS